MDSGVFARGVVARGVVARGVLARGVSPAASITGVDHRRILKAELGTNMWEASATRPGLWWKSMCFLWRGAGAPASQVRRSSYAFP